MGCCRKEDEYYPGHAGYDYDLERWRDADGRFTTGPCHEEEEDEYECECEEEEEEEEMEPLCGCYTRVPVNMYR